MWDIYGQADSFKTISDILFLNLADRLHVIHFAINLYAI